ncbi:hypothetical protein [Aestuariivirga litoralis]|uniref:hypothetical protein n=1 Tax=Aestuariivirga litoralis TaxID=2650924 RepID=UPI0018C65A56|nr:hypothetical protein [Aestuariivirga litoralis]MBG1232416.1 hypothetical protein [Aestuariivirga litoralis]
MIARLLELAVTVASAQSVAHNVKRSAKAWVVKIAAGAIAVLGGGFLLSALWMVLAAHYGAILASTWIGLGLVVLGAVVALIGLLVLRERVAPPAQVPDIAAIVQNLAQEVDVNFSRKGTPTKSVAAAVAGGFALGRILTRA